MYDNMSYFNRVLNFTPEANMEIEIYKLEQLGLGKAPFRMVGFWQMPMPANYADNPAAYNNIMNMAPRGISIGSSAICGVGIINHYIIESADNQRHAVGCDCVLKINNKKLTTEIKELQRKARQEKKEAERRAKAEAYEAELQAQKEKNGGLTDYELGLKKAKEAQALANAPKIELLSSLVWELKDGNGGFCDSIAKGMEKGFLQPGRGLAIACDILAKKRGRANSKAYKARYQEVEEIFEKVLTM